MTKKSEIYLILKFLSTVTKTFVWQEEFLEISLKEAEM
jgi:hypothetical protein